MTHKQTEIPYHLYRFRYLTTNQFTQLYQHAYPHRIQLWLSDLTQKKYIIRFYDRHEFIKNTKPAIYCLATKSKTILRQHNVCHTKYLNTIYREKQRSYAFQQKCIFIADIFLYLKKRCTPITEFQFWTKNELVAFDYFPSPLPDAYFEIYVKQMTKRFFVYVFQQGCRRDAMRLVIKRLFQYAREGDWEANTQKTFPSILLVFPDGYSKAAVNRFTQRIQIEAYEELTFFSLTTEEKALLGEIVA